MNYKRCNYCDTVKNSTRFHKDKSTKDGYSRRCIKCTMYYFTSSYKNKEPHFTYGDHVVDVLKSRRYVKDRAELFKKNGNGWWWELDKTPNERYLDKDRLHRKRFAGKFSKEE